jgi:hypothetical protein
MGQPALRRRTDARTQKHACALSLTRSWPARFKWDEVQEEGICFSAKLTELVNAGVRPALPAGCEPAPEGYRELMEQCWSGRPGNRPTFGSVLETLALIVPHALAGSTADTPL